MLARHLAISRSMLFAVMACFFLPFVTVSCNGLPAKATLSGMHLVTGGPVQIDTPEGPQASDEPASPRLEMIVSFLLTITALGISFLKIPATFKSVVLILCSGVSFLFFLVFKVLMDLSSNAQVLVSLNLGFWLAWMLIFATIVLNIIVVFRTLIGKPLAVTAAPTVLTTPQESSLLATGPSEQSTCPHCSQPVEGSPKFCMHCGQSLGPPSTAAKTVVAHEPQERLSGEEASQLGDLQGRSTPAPEV